MEYRRGVSGRSRLISVSVLSCVGEKRIMLIIGVVAA